MSGIIAGIYSVKSPEGGITIHLPLAGNTWVSQGSSKQSMITDAGIGNWSDANAQFDTYLRITQPGSFKVSLKAKASGESRLQVTIDGISKTVTVRSSDYDMVDAGRWTVKDTGYLRIRLSGLSRTGARFADVSEYAISGSAIDEKTAFVKNNEGNFFYWGRRGPSVHLNFPFADSIKAQWFYNEITVPAGQDIIGSYFMANGFGEGYFGIQVNSPAERRILFSVWSPFHTDNPASIPSDQRITLLKKGEGVYAGEFGNEGSGGQSYLRYYWKAGNTYKFLLKGEPGNNDNTTTYTAYFFAPEKNTWMLIASFKRPRTNTWLKRFHSFLENFDPEQGDKTRKVLFSNQWIADEKGKWTELNKAVFTYDNTAAKSYRMDYAGGIEQNEFFLKNCGFFNQYTLYRTVFERPATGMKPSVDLNQLP